MNAPTVVTRKFPQFGKEPALDPNEVPPDFVREPVIGSRETIDPDNSDNQPTVTLPRQRTVANFLPRMRTIASISNVMGVALIAGALVQIYYSGLAPLDAWSAPALSSFLAVLLLNVSLVSMNRADTRR